MSATIPRMRQRSLFEPFRTTSADPPVWDLRDLYISDQDPAMEEDRAACLKAASDFETAYQGRVDRMDAPGLAEALLKLERIHELEARVLSYAQLRFAEDTRDPEADRLHGRGLDLSGEVRSKVLFFLLEWAEVSKEHTDALLLEPCLDRHRHVLELSCRRHAHHLSPSEERVLERFSPVGPPAWASLSDKVVGGMRFGAEGRSVSQVLKDFSSPRREVRATAAGELSEGVAGQIAISGHVLNTVAQQRRISDRLRGFTHWMGERVIEDETDVGTVETLVEQVRSSYGLVRRYYRLKARLMDRAELMDFDRLAPMGPLPGEPYSWGRAREIVCRSFERFTPELGRIANMFFERGWVHAAERSGKRAGAFCHQTVPRVHPYVLLSFGKTAAGLLTLAHELGHGVHQYLSRNHSVLNRVPLPMAETASLFGELLVFDQLMQEGSASERLVTGCLRVERIIATTFRQVSLHCFESSVHERVGRDGPLGAVHMGELFLQSQKELYGESLGLSPGHEHWWAVIPHFVHTPGYVYAYAYAQLLVLAMSSLTLEDPKGFATRFTQFLSLGGSRSPEELLQPFGLDPRSPDPFRVGLSVVEKFLNQIEELADHKDQGAL
jgi:oligoendopeptidase F